MNSPFYFTGPVPMVSRSVADFAFSSWEPDRLSGRLELSLYNLNNLLVGANQEHTTFMKDSPTIPGTSIKGMLRALYEACTDSCILFLPGKKKGDIEFFEKFKKLSKLTAMIGQKQFESWFPCSPPKWGPEAICPSCSLFGYAANNGNAKLRSRVSVSEAWLEATRSVEWKPERKATPGRPNIPLEVELSKGRKFYFHGNFLDHSKNAPANYYPLKTKERFRLFLDYENLKAEELGALLRLLLLEPNWGHKLGFGKPWGWGSVQFRLENWVQGPPCNLSDRRNERAKLEYAGEPQPTKAFATRLAQLEELLKLPPHLQNKIKP